MTKPDIILVTTAADFAARRHIDQRRKGAAREPYINHLIEVAALLSEGTNDAVLVAAGLLHDTLEDTATEYEELVTHFGAQIAGIVAEVTDDKSLPKAERKQRQVSGVAQKSVQARLLKIADKTSNLRAIANSPPAHWDVARQIEYIDWSEQVVAGCRGLNPSLEREFDNAAALARKMIGNAVDRSNAEEHD
jgi:(p)ppGpp synthase/HD superfamily hydrolase